LAKWCLTGLDTLPEREFEVSNTSGVLKPTQEDHITITFNSHEQEKFVKQLTLEVEDVENLGVKQPPEPIEIIAEAFNITVQ